MPYGFVADRVVARFGGNSRYGSIASIFATPTPRIAEAVSQVRQAAGYDAALRILEIDPDSRLPERRATLAPYPNDG